MDAHPGSLVGRQRELARLSRLLAEGGALMLRGARGSGVTALLDAAVADVAVLRATGVAGESGFEYGALHQLLRPLRRRPPPALPDLPDADGDIAEALRAVVDRPVVVDGWQWIDRATRDAVVAFAGLGTQPVLLGGTPPA